MSLANAVAGPSRVRTAQTALRAAASVRHQSTRPRRWLEPNPHQEAVENAAKAWKSAVVPDSRDPAVWHSNYLAWRQTVGQVYKVNVAPGRPYGKAVWLGEEVPFDTNPSFQPPPPISDVTMTEIAEELRSGEKTVGQIATQYSISKARIEAIGKLKEVEAEFRRQNIPLCKSYQQGMEQLLGCALPYSMDGKDPTPKQLRQEEIDRISHESTEAELQEEERGKLGSFGDLRKQADDQGLEKESWAFVSEAEYVSGSSAAQQAMDAASEVEPRPPKPDYPSNYNKPGKNVFRFIDTSKQPKAAGKKK